MKTPIATTALLAATTLFAHTDDPLERPAKANFSIVDKFHFYGDLRIRHQAVHRDDKDNSYEERYRTRIGMSYDMSDRFIFEAQVTSGKGNPTSGNVSFSKGIGIEHYKIDVLDLEYKLDDDSWVRAGKSKHYFYRPMKTQLIWDNDIRPEGVSYGHKDGNRFTAAAWKVHRLENKEASSGDIYMLTAQYVHRIDALHVGGGLYYYNGVKGNVPPYAKGALGNSLDENGRYAHDYTILEAMAEYKFGDILGKPFKAAVILAYNAAVSDENFAYDFSAQWGETKEIYDWRLGYTYRDLQKDAVYAAHNDSDFINGGTDGYGHIFTGKMKLHADMFLAFHYQWTTRKVFEGDNFHYDRLMADIIFKF